MLEGKVNNMEQVQIEYWEMNVEKDKEFNFLNEEVQDLRVGRVKAWLM